ncbi:LLM class flavin-dependent oxidoreductase [Mycolicibacterium nivoides]|uniref:LLM class flavin-dependent oxidoreductase n=1 Tax=Mycolicibacterium nivoides TaxID=2487344 RepID=UPI003C2CA40E
MRFSVIAGARQNPDRGETAAEAWWPYVEDAVRAEELGFDATYVCEHHFCYAMGGSSPLMMLAHIAARTERIRIGTAIICPPLHNPLRLAEDIAALDIMSRGRLDLGVGVGWKAEEFGTFGVDLKDRFSRTWETLDLIERCMSTPEGETFDHEGQHYRFPNVRWIMQPVQQRIPILWGGIGAKGVQRAAERGYHLLAPDRSGDYERIMKLNGRRPEDHLIGAFHTTSVADTRNEAFEGIAAGCLLTSNAYAERPDLKDLSSEQHRRLTMADLRRGWEKGEEVGFCTPHAGTVEDMLDYFLPFVRGEHGLITHLIFEFRPAGTSTEHVERSMTLFANEVLPVLRQEAAQVAVGRNQLTDRSPGG